MRPIKKILPAANDIVFSTGYKYPPVKEGSGSIELFQFLQDQSACPRSFDTMALDLVLFIGRPPTHWTTSFPEVFSVGEIAGATGLGHGLLPLQG
jgi:hypothetical protein